MPALSVLPTVEAHQLLTLDNNKRPTLLPLLEAVTPAVVNISVTGTTDMQQNSPFQDPNLRRYFRFPEQGPVVPRQGAGSGVIVDAANGYVLTNHHVIERADEITVILQDRR